MKFLYICNIQRIAYILNATYMKIRYTCEYVDYIWEYTYRSEANQTNSVEFCTDIQCIIWFIHILCSQVFSILCNTPITDFKLENCMQCWFFLFVLIFSLNVWFWLCIIILTFSLWLWNEILISFLSLLYNIQTMGHGGARFFIYSFCYVCDFIL